MNEELTAILKMVESGKISAEEGAKLIASLNTGKEKTEVVKSTSPSKSKFIRIEVYAFNEFEDKEETKVKINVPVNLAKTVLQMNSIKNQISVNTNDIDIDFDELLRLIENNAEGELVNIESGKTRVRIWVE